MRRLFVFGPKRCSFGQIVEHQENFHIRYWHCSVRSIWCHTPSSNSAVIAWQCSVPSSSKLNLRSRNIHVLIEMAIEETVTWRLGRRPPRYDARRPSFDVIFFVSSLYGRTTDTTCLTHFCREYDPRCFICHCNLGSPLRQRLQDQLHTCHLSKCYFAPSVPHMETEYFRTLNSFLQPQGFCGAVPGEFTLALPCAARHTDVPGCSHPWHPYLPRQ